MIGQKRQAWRPVLLGGDPAAAQHEIAIVEYRRLPWRNGALGIIENYLHARGILGWPQEGGSRNMLVPDFNLGAERSFKRWYGNPIHVMSVQAVAEPRFSSS